MLLEIRIGPGKKHLKDIVYEVARKCRLDRSKFHRVPHMTLFGNFSAFGRVDETKQAIEEVCRSHSPLKFDVDGYESRKTNKGWVVSFKIRPSEKFARFRNALRERMLRIARSTQSHDFNSDSWFHITIAYKLSESEYQRVWAYLTGSRQSLIDKVLSFLFGRKAISRGPHFSLYGLRITLLNDLGKIMYEYDFLQRRFLSREMALSRDAWRRTISLFRGEAEQKHIPSVMDAKESKIFLVSDLHLDHDNIIRYCKRPFRDAREMNNVLIRNWNDTIREGDLVYFLGDLAFGRGSRTTEYYLQHLNGKKIIIRGNHDREYMHAYDYKILNYKGHEFLLVHNPHNLPLEWNGWVVHGHTHSNAPFINGERKTINVSVDVLNFKPFNIDYLISLDYKKIRRMDTIDSKPVYF